MPIGSLSSCYYLRLSAPLRLNLSLLCSKNFILYRHSHTFFSLSSMAFPPRLDNSPQHTGCLVFCRLPCCFSAPSQRKDSKPLPISSSIFPRFFLNVKVLFLFFKNSYMSTVFIFASFPLLFSHPYCVCPPTPQLLKFKAWVIVCVCVCVFIQSTWSI